MRLKATDPGAEYILAVLIDGKRVVWPIEFDTEEGWCIAMMPAAHARVEEIVNPDPDQDNPETVGETDLQQVRLTGKVEVAFYEQKVD